MNEQIFHLEVERKVKMQLQRRILTSSLICRQKYTFSKIVKPQKGDDYKKTKKKKKVKCKIDLIMRNVRVDERVSRLTAFGFHLQDRKGSQDAGQWKIFYRYLQAQRPIQIQML